jgi:hypothetical protein
MSEWIYLTNGAYSNNPGDLYSDDSGIFTANLYFGSVGGAKTLHDVPAAVMLAVQYQETFIYQANGPSTFDPHNATIYNISTTLSGGLGETELANTAIVSTDGPLSPLTYTNGSIAFSSLLGVNIVTYTFVSYFKTTKQLPLTWQDPGVLVSPDTIIKYHRTTNFGNITQTLTGEGFTGVSIQLLVSDGTAPPLRMRQRDDGLGIQGHARLNQEAAQGSTSVNTGIRLHGKNTYT